MCKGPCKQVFHYSCAAAIDKRVKNHPQSTSVSKQKYLCKVCYYEVKGKKKPGRKTVREIETQIDPHKPILDDENNPVEMSIDVQPKVKQVLKLIETDPEAIKYTTNSHENVVIDKVIKREIFWIDKLRVDVVGDAS